MACRITTKYTKDTKREMDKRVERHAVMSLSFVHFAVCPVLPTAHPIPTEQRQKPWLLAEGRLLHLPTTVPFSSDENRDSRPVVSSPILTSRQRRLLKPPYQRHLRLEPRADYGPGGSPCETLSAASSCAIIEATRNQDIRRITLNLIPPSCSGTTECLANRIAAS